VTPELGRVRDVIATLPSALVAFSGGVDSAVVLKVAFDVLGARAKALTAVGPALPTRELAEARRIAAEIGVDHLVVDSHESEDPNYRENPVDRCYYCKSELYRITAREASRHGLSHVLNGTNRDDLGDHRPGLVAADEAGVMSPLVVAGLDKAAVRAVARELGLGVWDKPAAACLASRIPYGTEVTRTRLAQIEALEVDLRALGLRVVRVRYHHEVARIEVGEAELAHAFAQRDAIVAAARRYGFAFAALDLAGYRQGALNHALPLLKGS
jgi:uncharacterized protein